MLCTSLFVFFLIFVCKQCRVSCAQSTYPYSGSSSWLLPQFGRVHFYAHIAFFVWLRWHFVALCGISLRHFPFIGNFSKFVKVPLATLLLLGVAELSDLAQRTHSFEYNLETHL
uniref:Putative secreted protein n=1 Tax=Rhipicephalus microplus TaxID=6941 RepID=A0A6G5A0M7_RHIMP